MLEAHILPHLLAASLAAAQPAPPAATPTATVQAEAAPTPVPAPQPADPIPPITTAAPTSVPGQRDPLEGFNRFSYRISQPFDRFIFRPTALAYKKVVPHPLRDGARNFISNLFEPVVFLNDVLQLRPKRALRTAARMAVNTALGLGGLFDVAKRPPYHLPHHENGFGDTLGYYGIGPIVYVYLPILGPTTLRDMAGSVGDAFAEPRLLEHIVHPDSDKPWLRDSLPLGRWPLIVGLVSGIDRRAESDQALETIRRTSVDPYATLRSSYLQDRAGEIAGLKAHSGQAQVSPALDDPLADPAKQ